MKRFRWFLLLCSAALILPHCAHKQRFQEVPNDGSDASQMFQKAESALKSRDHEKAYDLYRKVRTKYPDTRYSLLALYRLASAAYHKRDYSQASQMFQEMLRVTLDTGTTGLDDFKVDASYNLAACEYQQKQYEKAYQVLATIDIPLVVSKDSKRAEMVYSLIERTAKNLGDGPGNLTALSAHAQLPVSKEALINLEREMEKQIASINDSSALEGILSGLSGNRVRPIVMVEDPVVRAKIQDRIQQLTGISVGNPVPPNQDGTMSPLPQVVGGARGIREGSGNIGVILPLTGKFSLAGKRALESMLLAVGLFNANSSSTLKLYVEDSGSSEVLAERAVGRLVNGLNVSAIVGPISAKEAIAVGKKAQELGVVNISLTSRDGVTDMGAMVFQNALTPRIQVESLVDYCIKEKGFKRFAILAPSDSFGTDMAMQFWDAVERNGGLISAMEVYGLDDTDYQQQLQKMVGLWEPNRFRKAELEKIAEFHKEQKKKNPRYREKKIRLQPIVDFDALFIPDIPKVVSQIVPNLAYFDIRGAALLGTAEWGTSQFYRRVGKAAIGSLFPVAIHPESRKPMQFSFINSYREAMGTVPDLLAAQAYEAIEIVGQGLSRAGGSDTGKLAEVIAEMKDFESPLGRLEFDAKRVAVRKLPIFSIDTDGTMVEVSNSVE